MIIYCLYDKLVQLSELKPHPKNRNVHPKEQIQQLAKILKYQGWRYPVKVSKRSGLVTTGHGRIEAAKLNGWETVPVNFQEYESEEQEYADLQADNAIARWAELDLESIRRDMETFPSFNKDLLGIQGLDKLETEKPSKAVDPADLAQQFIVCAYLKNEEEMQEIYAQLLEQGIECKLIT